MRGNGQHAYAITIKNLSKNFGAVRALSDVSIDIQAGEFVSLLGPSGSGKSTLLMAIAGFVSCESGEILVNGADISNLPAEKRALGVVFQGYALFPHMTVFENIAYPLKTRKVARHEIEARVKSALDLVQLTGKADYKPRQLSGGQQQRVALARAFVFNPGIVLLDEPLGALDKKLRTELQFELKSLHNRLGTTFVNVTHDQEEAMVMSDRIAILKDGALMQVGTPHEVYQRPTSEFVSEFVGQAAFLRGRVVTQNDCMLTVECGSHRFAVPAGENRFAADEAVKVLLRPERLRLLPAKQLGDTAKLMGTVSSSAFLGSQTLYVIKTELGEISITTPSPIGGPCFDGGSLVGLIWDDEAAIAIPVAS